MLRCHGDGSEVHTIVLRDAVLPSITFSYSLKAAAALFADAAAILSLPQNVTTIQPTVPAQQPTRRLQNKVTA
jgi:hypothetical protein